MMSMLRSRWLWSILGVSAGVWAYRRATSKPTNHGSIQRSQAMWRRSARTARTGRTGSTMRPTALSMAAKAGRAMMDTTMRTVRAMNRG